MALKHRFTIGFISGFVAALACVAAGGLAFVSLAMKAAKRNFRPPLTAAAPADQDLQLESLDGTYVKLSSLRGKVVFLNIWGTWCPPCVAELPTIQSLYDQLKNEPDIRFVIASRLDPPGVVKQFARLRSYTLPFYMVSDDFTPPRFSSDQYPATFIVDKGGAIASRHVGGADWNRPEVAALLRKLAVQ